jgi:dTMP kinase
VNTLATKMISIEGGEGTGKSTAFSFIEQFFTDKGLPFESVREPGGTVIGEAIREVLLQHHQQSLCAKTEALLMFASRAQLFEEKIKPILAQGKWVLSDRFTDASYAYQGGGRQLGLDRIDQLAKWVLSDFVPTHTILLDAPVELCLQRIKGRGQLDRIESEGVDFFQRIRDSYLALAKKAPDRFTMVDASQSIEAVNVELEKVLQRVTHDVCVSG